MNKLNDPEAVRKRSKLMLPEPQISDYELEEIAKMGYARDFIAGEAGAEEGSGVTRALLSNYSRTPLGMTPLPTSQRTPGGKGDAIMMEAEVSTLSHSRAVRALFIFWQVSFQFGYALIQASALGWPSVNSCNVIKMYSLP